MFTRARYFWPCEFSIPIVGIRVHWSNSDVRCLMHVFFGSQSTVHARRPFEERVSKGLGFCKWWGIGRPLFRFWNLAPEFFKLTWTSTPKNSNSGNLCYFGLKSNSWVVVDSFDPNKLVLSSVRKLFLRQCRWQYGFPSCGNMVQWWPPSCDSVGNRSPLRWWLFAAGEWSFLCPTLPQEIIAVYRHCGKKGSLLCPTLPQEGDHICNNTVARGRSFIYCYRHCRRGNHYCPRPVTKREIATFPTVTHQERDYSLLLITVMTFILLQFCSNDL
jgi:hypothetical protein